MTVIHSNQFVDDPARQCHGKRGYRTKAYAKLRIRRMRWVEERESLHAYRCVHCGAFHIGHRRG